MALKRIKDMNNLQNKKIVNETGVLPAIIADKKVFEEMTKGERSQFYISVNKIIAGIDHKRKRTRDLYKMMCLYPEVRLNQAFLENHFKNESSWHFYVNVLEHCLYEHLMTSLNSFQELHKKYMVEMGRAEKRIEAMQEDLNKYLPK